MRKERFPSKRKSKLMPRSNGPFEILEKVGPNAYKVDLPGDYGVSATFNVSGLSPYFDDEPFPSLRENFHLPGGNGGDHHKKPKYHQAQPKEDSLKLQEVKEVAKLCRKLVFMPEEVLPPSSRNNTVFVCTFGLANVDPQLGDPYAFKA